MDDFRSDITSEVMDPRPAYLHIVGVMQKLVLAVLVLVVFTTYSVLIAIEHGPLGFVALLEGGWSQQVFLDLALALTGFFTLAIPDAKRRGISAWPYVLVALLLGSIGMLAYFVHRELKALRKPALA